jgi:predicted AAA+ superfamily ATPase
MDHVPRLLTRRIVGALAERPVVVLQGVRRCGKSTLAREIARQHHTATYVTFDDPATLARAQEDPMSFIASIDGPVVVDEVQRVPQLFVSVKAAVGLDRRPGRFLLTSSIETQGLPYVASWLMGDGEFLTLEPLSQGELHGDDRAGPAKDFITVAFRPGSLTTTSPTPSRGDLVRRALEGGFPEAVGGPDERRSEWFREFVTISLGRSIRDVAGISGMGQMAGLRAVLAASSGGLVDDVDDSEHLAQLPELLSWLADRNGRSVDHAELAVILGLPETAVRRLVGLLDVALVVQRLPAKAASADPANLRAPKIHVADSGLLAHLAGLDEARLSAQPELATPLLCTFVVNELFRQKGFSATGCTFSHFCTRSDGEVDVVLEGPGRAIVGIQVTASDTASAADIQGLQALRDQAGERFARGLILHTGERCLTLGERIESVPIATLWV